MCQLTLANLGNKEYNKLYMYSQFWINSETTNHEGCGLFQQGSAIFKTKLQPQDISNLGYLLNKHVINENPVLGHVRLASWGMRIASIHYSVTGSTLPACQNLASGMPRASSVPVDCRSEGCDYAATHPELKAGLGVSQEAS